MKIINYKGETLETIYEDTMSNETFEKLKKEFYSKPNIEDIKLEIGNLIHQNGVKMTNIERMYFRDLMSKTKIYYNKWSIEDCFEYKPLLDTFYSKTLKNKKVFTSENLLDNIETAFRLGGKGVASKVANFPIQTVDEIFEKYNVNNNYYDMSCGWGARLTSSLKNKVNYYGTDPNYLLVDRLKQYSYDWQEITGDKINVDIRCQGSEIFVKEWQNKMGLCFTSPPYFYLEDYKIGNQSWKKGTSYQDWLDNYLKPTIINCEKYLIDSGYLIINIKNFDKYNLEQDTKNICENNGFTYIENYILKNISRVKSDGNFNNTNENIMVFMKKGCENLHNPYRKPKQLDLFDF